MSRTVHVTFPDHKKIHAIKYVRELSNLGLREAKDTVEGSARFTTTLEDWKLAAIIEQAACDEVSFTCDPPLVPASSTPLPAGWAVRYHSGPNKIEAIKLTRELTGVGLKEAKDIVELQGVIIEGLARERAEDIVARFAKCGSVVVLEGSGGARLPAPPTPAPTGTWVSYGRPREEDDF
jgi:ribosomal protein L7/L12